MNASLLVRAHDSLTSVLAAEAASAFSGPHCERTLLALKQGPGTAQELQDRTGLTVVQIDRRLPELFRNGKLAWPSSIAGTRSATATASGRRYER